MNCRNLEAIITEVARGQMLDARVKEDAHAHMGTCKRCAARFADEQTLTAGLRAVAASFASMETPAHIETALLKAFRQGASRPFVVAKPPAQPIRTPWLPWSIAAAAAILMFSIFALPRLLPGNSGERAAERASNAQPIPDLSPTVTANGAVQEDNSVNEPLNDTVNSGDSPNVLPPSPRMMDRRRAVLQNAGLKNRTTQRANTLTPTTSANEEITTEFLPLSYGSNLSQLDEGQVIRVELPRSALQSFGLPVNAERVNERVKADVLLGHDGVARAIRFVR
jgi:hypothetical protein